MNFTDWRGTPIKPGSIIIYGTRSGSSLYVTEGEVVDVIPIKSGMVARLTDAISRETDRDKRFYLEHKLHQAERLAYKLKVKRLREAGIQKHPDEPRFWGDPDGKVVPVTKVERVTVLAT